MCSFCALSITIALLTLVLLSLVLISLELLSLALFSLMFLLILISLSLTSLLISTSFSTFASLPVSPPPLAFDSPVNALLMFVSSEYDLLAFSGSETCYRFS